MTSLPSELAHWVEQTCDVGPIRDAVPLLGGRINQIWKLSTDGGAILLRGYPPTRSPYQIAFELKVLQHLHEAGVPVTAPLGPAKRSSLHEALGRQWVVLRFLPGVFLRRHEVTPDLRLQMLRLWVTMSAALKTFDSPFDPVKEPRMVRAQASRLRERLRELGPVGVERADQVDRLLHQVLTACSRTDLPQRVLHGDLRPQNFLHQGDEITGIIDFDDAHLGYRVFDVAQLVVYLGRNHGGHWSVSEALDVLRELRGYMQFTQAEWDVLPAAVGLQAIKRYAMRAEATPDDAMVLELPQGRLVERLEAGELEEFATGIRRLGTV